MNSRQTEPENDNIQERVEAELINLLYQNASVALVGTGITATIVFLFTWNIVPIWLGSSWLALLWLLYIVRLYQIRRFHLTKPDHAKILKWRQIFVIGALLSGILWGIASILIFIYGTPDYYRISMLVSCGLAAASMVTHASSSRAYYFFVFPALLPPMIGAILQGNIFDIVLGILTFVFLAAMIFLANQMNTTFRKELELRFVNEKLNNSLMLSEERYRLLAANSSDVIWTMELTGKITYMTPSVKRVLGYAPDEMREKNIKETFSPTSAERLMRWLDDTRTIVESGQHAGMERMELEQISKNGAKIWFDTTLNMIYDDDGQFIGILGTGRDITKRRQLEEEHRKSEEKYRIVADFTSDWEYWQAPDKTFRYISPSCKEFTGYSPQDFMDDPELFINIVHPDDRELFEEHLWDFNSKEIITGLDFRITRRDGEIRWISHICRPLYSDTGEFLGRRISNRDITERKQIEEALKENEEKLRTITQTAQDAIIQMDNAGKISFWNPAAEQIFGYTNKEAIGKELHSLLAPEKYRDDYQKGLNAFKLTGTGPLIGTTRELEATKKNGTLIEVELSLSSIRLKGTWHAVGILRDITKRKEADNKLKDNEHSLSEAQRIAHLGNWDWNIITNELSWSDEIYRIFGLTPHQFSATYPAFLNTVHPDDRTAVVNAVNEAVNHRKPYNIEHRVIQPHGAVRIVSEQGEVTYDESGKAIRMIGTVQDITEKKLYEQQLKEANATKDKFFSIISHDLKNPFNALLGSAGALHENLDNFDKDDIADLSNIIYRSSQSAYALLDNLLEWSRSQTGRLEFKPEKLSLKDIAYDSIKSAESQAQAKEVALHNKTGDITVLADPNLLKTIIRNLLSNAIKYTNKGGSVTVSSKQDNNMVEVSVSDTGVGMSPEAIEKLFRIETKYSTPGTEKETGTGLGLILCKEFVEKHGGKIWAESEVGKGTTFIFTLQKPAKDKKV